MGLFSFLSNVGKSLKGGPNAKEIQTDIVEALGEQVKNLAVAVDKGVVTLKGEVDSEATRQKVVLLAGNVKGVSEVNDDGITVKPRAEPEPAFTFYTIASGDSLSKIAKKYYGNANLWPTLFEANREVIKNPDLIYPGQQIRVPAKTD